jgi:uncharacterized membrane protein
MAPRERLAHWAFVVGMVGKGIDGVLELAGAIALVFIAKARMVDWVESLARHRFTHGLGHTVAVHAAQSIHQFGAGTQHFAVLYLFTHGVIKLGLVTGLLLGVRWIFPVALAVLTGFIGYQLYRLSLGPSWLLAALTVIDAIVVALVWHEWRHHVM